MRIKYTPIHFCQNLFKTKRLLAFILAICLVFSTFGAFPVHATSIGKNLEFASQVINKYSNSDIVFSIIDSKGLLSPTTNEFEYTLYRLHPYGYAVLFNSTSSLMEACYQNNSIIPIDMDNEADIYYGGPMNYMIMKDDQLHDASTGHCIADYELSQIRLAEGNVVALELTQANSFNSSSNATGTARIQDIEYFVEADYFETLYNFGNNTEGTCTVVAIAMLLGYYDNFVSDTYVSSHHESGTGTNDAFHQHLNDYVFDGWWETPRGIFINDAADGIDNYLFDRDIMTQLHYNYTQGDDVSEIMEEAITLLESDKPIVASMGTRLNATFDHTVLVYGTTFNPTNMYNTAVYHMHTGWHGNSTTQPMLLTASAKWFYEYGYINCVLQEHEYSMFSQFSSTRHRGTCICGEEAILPHNMVQTSTGSRCSDCGYVP